MSNDLTRRRFHEITVAAFGGLMAGSIAGCSKEKPKTETVATAEELAAQEEAKKKADLHLCRGLNTCKGKGKGGSNDCAGTSTCATFAQHECAGDNDCKGQGGCGANPGANECKGKGACHVPLMDHAWDKMRKSLEEKFKTDSKELGKAPAAA